MKVDGDFQFELHDALLETIEIGPRREVLLRVVRPTFVGILPGPAEALSIRFGAIDNFEHVRRFFEALPHPEPDAYWDQILDLRQSGTDWTLELDHGGKVRIQSSKTRSFLAAVRAASRRSNPGR